MKIFKNLKSLDIRLYSYENGAADKKSGDYQSRFEHLTAIKGLSRLQVYHGWGCSLRSAQVLKLYICHRSIVGHSHDPLWMLLLFSY